MCQPVAYQPIALPADFHGIDMVALAKTVTQPCEHCGHKHDGAGVSVRDGSVLCQRCGFNSQPRVAAMLKHRRRAAAKVKRARRAAAKRPERVRARPTSTPRPRERRRTAPHVNGGGRDGSGQRNDGSGSDDSGGGDGDGAPHRSGAGLECRRQP